MRRRMLTWTCSVGLALGAMVGGSTASANDIEPTSTDRLWGVVDGFAIATDVGGFNLPTAIAFVPAPGSDPADPLYFVTELRGAIKVVSNDRTVSDFADLATFTPPREYPDLTGEGGLAGICIDSENGYVFVTYTYRDGTGSLRNGLSRFGNGDGVPVTASDPLSLDHIFDDEVSALSHQIGPCHVAGDSVFVSVGDGANPTASRDLGRVLGKLVRMTLDGMPHPDNPRAADGSVAYPWAWGLRNPFSLEVVEDEVYVADNGPSVDRFLRVEVGGDYLWDGTDWSIGSTADVVFSPSVGPVQMEHYPAGSSLFPDEYASGFYFASSAEESAGVIRVPFDTALGSSTGVSAHLVKSRASFPQAVTGLAFGPDGLYFTSILPDSSGTSAVFRLSYDPAAGYDLGLYGGDAEGLIGKYGCRSCHQLDGSGGAVGPALDTNALNIRVRSRLNSPEYSQLVADLDARNEDPWAAWSDERRAILDAGGRAQLARWVSAKIQEPRFDDPDAQMPQLGVTKAHADTMAAYLVGTPRPQPWYTQAVETVFGSRRALLTFAVGAMGGLALGVVGHVWWSRRQRRQGPSRT